MSYELISEAWLETEPTYISLNWTTHVLLSLAVCVTDWVYHHL